MGHVACDMVCEVTLPRLHNEEIPTKPLDKVRLFRSLFSGRENVFPTRFVAKKSGKSGYAPACANKFIRGVCELPRINIAVVETCRTVGVPVAVERSR